MSFFIKALAKLGIGAASVEAIIDNDTLQPGQEVSGVIKVMGGWFPQQVHKIELAIWSNYVAEEEYDCGHKVCLRQIEKQYELTHFELNTRFSTDSKQVKYIPFSFPLPLSTPLSFGRNKIWVSPRLDVDYLLGKSNTSILTIEPNSLQNNVFNALEHLGFVIKKVACEACSSPQSPMPFIQEFECKAQSGYFSEQFDELELVMHQHNDSLQLQLDFDYKNSGLTRLVNQYIRRYQAQTALNITQNDLPTIRKQLHQVLQQHC
ncbi:sporulation protein [uncultured Shewanella sp.]|uniref:sporulation protein n=1 Tax=uncultured Shewanella sp. TaxID=173975 RepID=UPI00261273DA|nr:sporulation protein [uncultured Shewanella sp.]